MSAVDRIASHNPREILLAIHAAWRNRSMDGAISHAAYEAWRRPIGRWSHLSGATLEQTTAAFRRVWRTESLTTTEGN